MMQEITLYGYKIARWVTIDGWTGEPCPPTLEKEKYVPVGIMGDYVWKDWFVYPDPKELLKLAKKIHVASNPNTGDEQHSSMIQVRTSTDGHGWGEYQWELRIYELSGWNVFTYHEEDCEIPDDKIWFVYGDTRDYADGTDVMRYFSTFDKACDMYHADPDDLEYDPFQWQRYDGHLTLGYIGLDGECNTNLMKRYIMKNEDDEE